MNRTRTAALAATALLAVTAVVPAFAQDTVEVGDAAGKKLILNMKGPGAGNPFWAAVEKGALETAAALGLDVSVMSPPAESDVASQIAQIEDAIAQGVAGIALAPTDPAALAPVVEEARAQGVQVVFIDTVGSNEGVTFIGTDNVAGAALAAQYLCDALDDGEQVAILQGIITQSTGQARATGAAEGLAACALEIVAELPADWDTAKALTVAEDILSGYPDLDGIFASNDNMALGALEAIKAAGLLDQITVVGYDANPNAADAVLTGELEATIAQAPYNMGKFGIESLVRLINGEMLAPVIDTGTVLVDLSNAVDFDSNPDNDAEND